MSRQPSWTLLRTTAISATAMLLVSIQPTALLAAPAPYRLDSPQRSGGMGTAIDGPQNRFTSEIVDMSTRGQEDTSTGGLVVSSTFEIPNMTTGGEVGSPTSREDPFYCGERKLGSWFYCEKPRPKPVAQASQNSAPPSITYRAQLDRIGARLEELKAKAVLEPTSDNIVAYVRAIWQHPELDYTLQRPVTTLGKTAWLDQRKADRDGVLASLSQRYGLFYFYSSSCGACEIFSPVVRSLSDKYRLSVLPVSMDGGATRAFPRFVVNHGQYEKMGLEGGQVPALVLFDTWLKKPIPIGYGILAEDEVVSRIFTLTSVKPGSDY